VVVSSPDDSATLAAHEGLNPAHRPELILRPGAALAQWRAEVAQVKATVAELARRWGTHVAALFAALSADPPQARANGTASRVAAGLAGSLAMQGRHGPGFRSKRGT
jgi:hypothetical protein